MSFPFVFVTFYFFTRTSGNTFEKYNIRFYVLDHINIWIAALLSTRALTQSHAVPRKTCILISVHDNLHSRRAIIENTYQSLVYSERAMSLYLAPRSEKSAAGNIWRAFSLLPPSLPPVVVDRLLLKV